MFDLDLFIINHIILKCKELGSIFNLGALEGFIMYSSTIAYVIATAFDKKRKTE